MPISRPRPYTNWDWNEALNHERGIRGTHGLLATEQPEPTPDELNAVYSKGFIGASPRKVPQHERAAVIQAKASRVSLYEAFPWLKRGVGRGKKLMPYQASLSLDTSWGGDESQTVGSCFPAGTMVRMADGSQRPIEQVSVGDEVVTHLGRVKRVTGTIEKPHSGNLLEISVESLPHKLRATPDHQFVEYSDICDMSVDRHQRWNKRSENMSWTAIEDLSTDSFVLMPRQTGDKIQHQFDLAELPECFSEESTEDRCVAPKPGKVRRKNSRSDINRFVDLDTRLAWVLGIYAAEGGVETSRQREYPTRVTFTLNSDEHGILMQLDAFLRDIFGDELSISYDKSRKTATKLRVNSSVVAMFLSGMVPGNVYSKRVPWQLMSSSDAVKTSFVKGWLDGDGHLNIKHRPGTNSRYCSITGVSVSHKFIEDVADILISMGFVPKVHKRKPRKQSRSASQVNLYGTDVARIYEHASVAVTSKSKTKRLKTRQGVACKVNEIKAIPFTGTVYCLEVEDDHSFIAEGYAVHNCVSHGCRNSAMCDYGVDVVFGETEWKGRICTENIYRHRGKNSHGWWCSAAASTIEVGGKGGLLYRKKYESPDGRDSIDLTRFSSRTEQWASNGSAGVPQWLRDIEDDNQAAFCIAITSIEEYLDAMYLGFGLNVCSGYGFSSSCDEYGFARQSGSWSHAMAHVGADDSEWAHQRYGDGIGLVMQSWGRWNNQDGRKCPDGFGIVPIGSFFASFKTIRKMIASDSYATCQVTGWDRRQPIQKYVQSSEFSDRIHERIKEREKAGSLLVA